MVTPPPWRGGDKLVQQWLGWTEEVMVLLEGLSLGKWQTVLVLSDSQLLPYPKKGLVVIGGFPVFSSCEIPCTKTQYRSLSQSCCGRGGSEHVSLARPPPLDEAWLNPLYPRSSVWKPLSGLLWPPDTESSLAVLSLASRWSGNSNMSQPDCLQNPAW